MQHCATLSSRFNGMPIDAPRMNARDVAAFLGVSTVTLWKIRKSGEFPSPAMIGGSLRWSRATIDQWVESQRG